MDAVRIDAEAGCDLGVERLVKVRRTAEEDEEDCCFVDRDAARPRRPAADLDVIERSMLRGVMGTLHDRCGEKMRRIIELAAIDSPSERFCFEQRAEHRSICRVENRLK